MYVAHIHTAYKQMHAQTCRHTCTYTVNVSQAHGALARSQWGIGFVGNSSLTLCIAEQASSAVDQRAGREPVQQDVSAVLESHGPIPTTHVITGNTLCNMS